MQTRATKSQRPRMNLLVSAAVLVFVVMGSSSADQSLNGNVLGQQQAQLSTADRQGRSIAGNNLSHNSIEHSSSKSRIEQEKRQVQEFLTTKNIFKSIVKLLFGNQEEISATSRHVLGILGKVSLDLLEQLLMCTLASWPNTNLGPTLSPLSGARFVEEHFWPKIKERNSENNPRLGRGCSQRGRLHAPGLRQIRPGKR